MNRSNYIHDLLKGRAEIVTRYTCLYHPDRAAVAICESCKADICHACASVRRNRLLCARCMGSVDKALGGTGAASAATRLLTHPLVVALVLTALLSGTFISFGRTHRRGLLGAVPQTTAEAEKQHRLAILLYVQKADRIEAYADALHEIGRQDEARIEYERARSAYEKLGPLTVGRWEEHALTLARARILEKMGEEAYARGLYESLAKLPGDDKTYPVIAGFHLARLQEKSELQQALQTYRRLLNDIKFVPDALGRAMDIMARPERAYNYQTRIRHHTRTDFDFESAKAETHLHIGRILLSLSRTNEARYYLSHAMQGAHNTKVAEQAAYELKKLSALEQPKELPEESPEPEERVVITHFD
ncbi:MAG: hypothetical protein C4532_07390 [Candidatus Abyssobacteria bacterium SURF_17]|uniref:Uncharacterized protein n=1 Tax=Candidatus Abyssobacteria bacterium SURF_17 TaxID=2093361 RepID=A0A419F166_9BACT|nr:MAG: hypothetical protein C4532_07390 [Candidatus Abyssubacteria bacterium SURF_17]